MTTRQLEFCFDAPAPGDLIEEIARRFGMRPQDVKMLHTRYAAPLFSVEAFAVWRSKCASRDLEKRRAYARKAARKFYRGLSPEEKSAYLAKYHHTEKNRAYNRARANAINRADPAAVRSRAKAYRAANREKLRASARLNQRKRLQNDPQFYIATLCRNRIRQAFRDGGRGTRKPTTSIKLLGCSYAQLCQHIGSQFTRGMTWELLLTGKVHLDHIVPIKNFDLTKPEQQRLCFHYSNLAPKWASENLSKRDRFKGTHQFPLLLD